MNITSPNLIKDYLERKFKGKYKLSSNNAEYIVPSLFIDNDYKRHMSINSKTGLWQCFKSGEAGDFYKLVSILEEVSPQAALSMFSLENYLTESPRESKGGSNTSTRVKPLKRTTKITRNMEPTDSTSSKAWIFVDSRKLWGSRLPFYITDDKTYKNRIIIPLAEYKDIPYFQARALDNTMHPKYINSLNIKKSAMLYPYSHKKDNTLVCEGPLDAISLQIQGVNATATMGCKISKWQAKMLSQAPGKIILAFDNDSAGISGIKHFERLRKQCGMKEFFFCFPPKGYKDWNEAHIAGVDLNSYINKNTEPFDFSYQITNALKQP
jgi:5S rRNA maturation endonuclease (ribonuclease M5)